MAEHADHAPSWLDAGRSATVDAMVLRFGATLNGLQDLVLDGQSDWFLVDQSGRLIDCSAKADGAASLLGAPITQIAGGVAAETFAHAWSQVLLGRAQAVWPWSGGRAKASLRSIELHPIRDVLSAESPIVGALVVIVDTAERTTLPVAA